MKKVGSKRLRMGIKKCCHCRVLRDDCRGGRSRCSARGCGNAGSRSTAVTSLEALMRSSMLCTKVHKPMLKRDMRRGSASLGAVAAKLRAFAQKEPTSPIIVVRTFARPNAMTSMICKFLEDRNMDFFRAVSQEDPKLSEYLLHITREIDSVIFVPKGTWRATPFLLRAAKKAGIAFIFVIDDNV